MKWHGTTGLAKGRLVATVMLLGSALGCKSSQPSSDIRESAVPFSVHPLVMEAAAAAQTTIPHEIVVRMRAPSIDLVTLLPRQVINDAVWRTVPQKCKSGRRLNLSCSPQELSATFQRDFVATLEKHYKPPSQYIESLKRQMLESAERGLRHESTRLPWLLASVTARSLEAHPTRVLDAFVAELERRLTFHVEVPINRQAVANYLGTVVGDFLRAHAPFVFQVADAILPADLDKLVITAVRAQTVAAMVRNEGRIDAAANAGLDTVIAASIQTMEAKQITNLAFDAIVTAMERSSGQTNLEAALRGFVGSSPLLQGAAEQAPFTAEQIVAALLARMTTAVPRLIEIKVNSR